MSEQQREAVYDYRNKPPYPEALKDKTKPVVVLNLHEPFAGRSQKSTLRYVFGYTENILNADIQGEERGLFEEAIKSNLEIGERGASFGRTSLLELPPEMYEVASEATRFSWGRLQAWDAPAQDAIVAFGLDAASVGDAEIVIIPPHKNKLVPYVTAIQDMFGKTPHFAFYTEIMYAGESWSLVEYRPGLRNYMGEVSGAI